ncbi:uncharacterized protein [Macrobrachium rosenbergii]|uniref:uncharacterized protein n=1 Tax=Macrobrachium rosenbergii TaxID=79674 RepID=UPI0034D685C9
MAYNPTVNGMVEREHRSLKAALTARCTNERWKEQLPWVLLGPCTTTKANGDASPGEKVCGETLVVPREFFPPLADGADTPFPSPPTLDFCTYVFIRVDVRQPPLTWPYRGPHRVIRRAVKACLLDIHGLEDWVIIDRLKPAFLLDSEVHEEAGRCPRVPPQYLPADTSAPPPKRGPGCPRGHIDSTPDVGPPHAHSSPGGSLGAGLLAAVGRGTVPAEY